MLSNESLFSIVLVNVDSKIQGRSSLSLSLKRSLFRYNCYVKQGALLTHCPFGSVGGPLNLNIRPRETRLILMHHNLFSFHTAGTSKTPIPVINIS